MEHGTVLHIGARADANVVHVTARDDQWPDARIFADNNAADEHRRRVNIRRSRDLWPLPFVRPNVRFSGQECVAILGGTMNRSSRKLLQEHDILASAGLNAPVNL